MHFGQSRCAQGVVGSDLRHQALHRGNGGFELMENVHCRAWMHRACRSFAPGCGPPGRKLSRFSAGLRVTQGYQEFPPVRVRERRAQWVSAPAWRLSSRRAASARTSVSSASMARLGMASSSVPRDIAQRLTQCGDAFPQVEAAAAALRFGWVIWRSGCSGPGVVLLREGGSAPDGAWRASASAWLGCRVKGYNGWRVGVGIERPHTERSFSQNIENQRSRISVKWASTCLSGSPQPRAPRGNDGEAVARNLVQQGDGDVERG